MDGSSYLSAGFLDTEEILVKTCKSHLQRIQSLTVDCVTIHKETADQRTIKSVAPRKIRNILNNYNYYTSHSIWKSDWSRAFDQFTIACELDMINPISAADIAFIMSSSTSAWLLNPLECYPQKQNGRTLRFCFWGWIMWQMCNKTMIEFGFRMISWIIKTSCLCYPTQPSADDTDLGFDNSWYHAQPHAIIV